MVRAFAVCAVILAACVASAQTVSPTIVPHAERNERLGIAISEPTPVSVCGERECPATIAETPVSKRIDNHALLRQKLAELNCLQSEIEALRAATGTPEQILVKLKVLEVSRTKMKKLGMDFPNPRGKPEAFTPANADNAFGPRVVNIYADREAVLPLIDKLQQENVAKVLAEQNVAMVCGRTAVFHVGGTVPILASAGKDAAIEFKPVGTSLELDATALGDNRIRLNISAKVSEVDHGRTVNVNGIDVPGFNVRAIKAPLVLSFDETAVLSGLIQQRHESIKRGSKIETQVNEIELIVVATPEATFRANGGGATGETYHTATSTSEARPGERSVRVTKPNAPR